jgi:hypothetical protein
MKILSFFKKSTPVSLVLLTLISFSSCDKASNLLLTDNEKLMKEIKGTWNLVSVHEEDLASNDGGNNFTIAFDSTYAATGKLDIATVDQSDYTGSLVINYLNINETHSINGSAGITNGYENLWIITNDQANILAMTIYSPTASYMQGWLDERDDNHILLRVSEAAWDNSAHVNRKFRFEKAK